MKSWCCPPQPDAAFSVAVMHGSAVGWSASLFSSLGNCDLSQIFTRLPLCPDPRTSHRTHPLFRKKKSDSVVVVLRFAHKVLHNLVPRVKEGDLWEVRIWSGSVALFLWNADHLTTAVTTAVSLTRFLGSANAHTAHSCRNPN